MRTFGHTVTGQRSASAVYREALTRMGYDSKGVHPTAMRTIFRALRNRPQPRAAGSFTDFNARFPDAARIKRA